VWPSNGARCPNSGSLILARAAYCTFGSLKTASAADAGFLCMRLSTGSPQCLNEVRDGC